MIDYLIIALLVYFGLGATCSIIMTFLVLWEMRHNK